MILARKILVPALALFALLLLVLLGYVYITFQTSSAEEEQRVLFTLNETFESEIENQEKIALSLAQEIASNADAQQAFASRDRDALQELMEPMFARLQQFNVNQIHFHIPPGVSFLRVHEPESFGDELFGYREMILNMNVNRQPLVGFETDPSGFAVRGLVPIIYEGNYIGSVEVGIDVGNALLGHLVEEYGNEWHILLTQATLVSASPASLSTFEDGPITNLLVYASTESDHIFNEPDAYTSALNGQNVTTHREVNGREYAIMSRPLTDHSGKTVGVFDVVVDRTDRTALQNNRLLIGGLAGLLVFILGSLGIALITTNALQPIRSLTTAATAISGGNLAAGQFEVGTQDEISELSQAFNNMAAQVRESISTLEQRVSERTRDLERRSLEVETISDVVREISIIRNLDTLLNVSVNLIRERFGYYHTGIYLADERGEFATLQTASGASAQQMIEQGTRLRISEMGPLGTALRAGQAYVALDVKQDDVLGNNPLLPNTTSEIILPLRILNVTIGALDIHSDHATVFDTRDVRTLQLLADQLAAAIENARLVQQVEGTVRELNKANRSQTQKAWQTTVEEQAISSYEYDGQQIRPVPKNLPAEQVRELENGRAVVVLDGTAGQPNAGSHNTLLVPLMVLNQLIGVIGLEQENPNRSWTRDEIAVAEAAANRAALTLENARLLAESQRRATKERTISESTARIGTALNVENILDITVEELERVLGSSEVILQINTDLRSSLEE
jgi:GAF domain-containing protein/HAMP domain-containing protein